MKRRGVGEEVKVRQRDWTREFLHAPTDFAIDCWTPFFAVKTAVRGGNEEEEEESDRGDDRPSLHRGVEISECHFVCIFFFTMRHFFDAKCEYEQM